jgi:hypothetical protein
MGKIMGYIVFEVRCGHSQSTSDASSHERLGNCRPARCSAAPHGRLRLLSNHSRFDVLATRQGCCRAQYPR